MNIIEIRCEGVDWIQLAQNMVHWLILVNMRVGFLNPVEIVEVAN
jgi:hypothetical protein